MVLRLLSSTQWQCQAFHINQVGVNLQHVRITLNISVENVNEPFVLNAK